MPNTTLSALFAQKAFANAALLDKLDGFTDTHPEENVMCRRTLNHALVVDRVFKGHLTGEPHGMTATNTPETPSLAELREAVTAMDQWYQAYVAGIAADALAEEVAFVFTDGQNGRMSRDEILHHVTQHGAYHRGNVGQVLRTLGITPSPDTLTSFLHTREPSRRDPPL
ncbi:putative damage-inducible protein DinB [Luteibacter sp. 621]|uniref:DinB family protein n=1 Tax=Luteibacter sp. 621 TaxID=3373916 RepID=UPI003D19B9A9